MSGASISVHDVVVDHGSVRALSCPSFSISAGESVAVMGPSGCGKSTLLGLLAGLAVPTSGTVSVGDVCVSSLSSRERGRFRRKHLGMVYQADNLLPYLTVEENVGLQLGISGTGSSVDPSLLGRLGLASLSERLPDQLSGGQRQRTAVARAIVHRPDVLLADEPTGALDDEAAGKVIELLIDVQRGAGATLVLVTHDPAIAAFAERTVYLDAH